jgi:two-component system, response regulator PdtaR
VNFLPISALTDMDQTPDGDHPTILVVDDDVLLRLHASDLLEENGYTIVEANSAEQALKVMETRKDVRMLFTDIQMPPGIDGLELARQVHGRWPTVLLVITSGQKQPTKAEIADDGQFISKPYRAQELLGKIGGVLKKEHS